MTNSMRNALEETDRRRAKQVEYNTAHGITPQSIVRDISDVLQSVYEQDYVTIAPTGAEEEGPSHFVGKDLRASIAELERKMRAAAADLEFETAARMRDEIKRLENLELGLEPNLAGRSMQDALPRRGPESRPAARGGKAEGKDGKKDWRPKPLGPGGGGYDPEKKRGGGRRGR
jgi:excinuclease ABC subunit B